MEEAVQQSNLFPWRLFPKWGAELSPAQPCVSVPPHSVTGGLNPEQNLLCFTGITETPPVSETFGSATLENFWVSSFMVSTHSCSWLWCSYLFGFCSVKVPNPGIADCLNVWGPFVRLKDKPSDAQCSLFRNMDRHCKPILKKKSKNHFKYFNLQLIYRPDESYFLDMKYFFFRWLIFFITTAVWEVPHVLSCMWKIRLLSSLQKTKRWTKVSQPWHCPPRGLNSPTKFVSITLPFPNSIQNISSKGSSGLGSWS